MSNVGRGRYLRPARRIPLSARSRWIEPPSGPRPGYIRRSGRMEGKVRKKLGPIQGSAGWAYVTWINMRGLVLHTHIYCTAFMWCIPLHTYTWYMCIFIFCMYRWGQPLKKKSKLENRVETPCELYYITNMFCGSKMDRVAINIQRQTHITYILFLYI